MGTTEKRWRDLFCEEEYTPIYEDIESKEIFAKGRLGKPLTRDEFFYHLDTYREHIRRKTLEEIRGTNINCIPIFSAICATLFMYRVLGCPFFDAVCYNIVPIFIGILFMLSLNTLAEKWNIKHITKWYALIDTLTCLGVFCIPIFIYLK